MTRPGVALCSACRWHASELSYGNGSPGLGIRCYSMTGTLRRIRIRFKLLPPLALAAVFLLAGCGGGSAGNNSTPSPARSPQPHGNFLYSLTLNTAVVYGFQTSAGGSQLTAIPGSPFASNGTRVDKFAADPQQGFLFVLNYGTTYAPGDNITTFSVDPSSGSLTRVSTLNVTGLSLIALAVNPTGNYLYATTGTYLACCTPGPGGIYTFSIGAGGVLKQVAYVDQPSGLGSAPTALAVDPSGAFLYAASAWESDPYHTGITVMAFALTNGGAALSLLATYPEIDPMPANTSASAVYANSSYVYASTSNGNALYVFQRHGDGTLSQVPSPTLSGAPSNLQGIAATPNGQFVYVADGDNARVLGFSVGADGALTQIGSFAVGSTGSNWISQVIADPSGNTLYAAGGNGGEIFVLSIGADGHLTQAPASPYFTDTQAASNWIVFY